MSVGARTLASIAVGLIAWTFACRSAGREGSRAPIEDDRARLEVSRESTSTTDRPLLRVRIVAEEDARPLPGLRLHVERKDDPSDVSVWSTEPGRGRLEGPSGISTMPLSDENGWAEIEVITGCDLVASVRASAFGAASVDVPALQLGELREVELALATADDVVFFGRVFDAADRRPIAGAAVKLRTQTVRSDAQGRFRISAASWRRDIASVNAEGYGPTTFRVRQGRETPGAALDVPLSRAARIVARVTNATGVSVVGATVTVSAEPEALTLQQGVFDWIGGEAFVSSATTDENGRCEFVDLPPRALLAIRAEHPSHSPQALPDKLLLSAGELREVDVALGAGVLVTGRIVDQYGQPASRISVWRAPAERRERHLFADYERRAAGVALAETRTDVDGRFEFESVAPGNWWIGPAPRSREESSWIDPQRVAPVGEWVELGVNERVRDLTLQVDRGLYLSGRVLDPSGANAARTFVTALASFPIDAWPMDWCSDDGAFVLGPLPAGTWRLAGLRSLGLGEAADALAASGSSDLVLVLETGATLRGRVSGAAATDRNDVEVWIQRRDEAHGGTAPVRDDGSFERTDLAPGLYDIVACTRDGLAGVRAGVEVQRGAIAQSVEVRVTRGAKLTVRLGVWANEQWARVVQDGVTVAWARPEGRSDAVLTVPAGVTQVELHARGARFDMARPLGTRTITLAAGDAALVDFGEP